MGKRINSAVFAEELKRAGLLGLPFSWGDDGVIEFGVDMTRAQIDAVNAIYAAHNPYPAIENIKASKIRALELQTTDYIIKDDMSEKRMPAWRQARWNNFTELYEKQAGGASLNPREQALFEAMIDPGQTAEQVYSNCMSALQWISQCLADEAAMEAEINALTDAEAVAAFDIISCPYPAWIGV